MRKPIDASHDVQIAVQDIHDKIRELEDKIKSLSSGKSDDTGLGKRISALEQTPTTLDFNDVFRGAGPAHAIGYVPDPGDGPGEQDRMLSEAGDWRLPLRGLIRPATDVGMFGEHQGPGDILSVLASMALIGNISANKAYLKDLEVTGVMTGVGASGAFVGCRLNRVADQTITSGVQTAISFTNESIDTSGMHEAVTNPSRITFVESGVYLVGGMFHFAPNTTGTYRYLYLLLNGDTQKYLSVQYHPATLGTDAKETTVLRNFSAGDYVELQAHHDASSNIAVKWQSNGEYTPIFWAYKVGNL